jgi:hypothetical protein
MFQPFFVAKFSIVQWIVDSSKRINRNLLILLTQVDSLFNCNIISLNFVNKSINFFLKYFQLVLVLTIFPIKKHQNDEIMNFFIRQQVSEFYKM